MNRSNHVVLFDLFGVVFSKGLESSLDHLKATMGVDEEPLAKAYRRWETEFDLGLIDEYDYWSRVNEELGTDVSPVVLSRIVIDSYRLNPYVSELIKFMSGNRTAIFSNYRREWFERLDRKWSVANRVERVFISSDLGIRKPDAEAFRQVAAMMDCSVGDLVLIDDEAANVRSLESLGGTGIHFRTPFTTEVKLRDSGIVSLPPYMHHYSGIFLRTSSGGLVFQRRDDRSDIENPGKLSVFGGRRLKGESSLDCAIRELTEETTLEVEPSQLRWLGTYSRKDKLSDGWIEAQYFLVDEVSLNALAVQEGSGLEVWYAKDAIARPDITTMPRQVIVDHLL